MPTDLIFHHYDGSPFSEKVRLVFGLKGIDWRSVKVPIMLPKPDVVALTGGYRRTPFLQIGADIYCDSALVCQVLDTLQPAPPLYPESAGGLQHAIAQWADSALFWSAVPYTMAAGGAEVLLKRFGAGDAKAFAADRAAMTTGRARPGRHDLAAGLRNFLDGIDTQLARGGPYLLGAAPCIADFSVVHAIWYMKTGGPAVTEVLDRHARIEPWYQRMLAFGHGRSQPMTSAEAIEVARTAGTHEPASVVPGLGFEPGAAVTVAATDYGTDAVEGTLVGLSDAESVIERRDERAGLVHVHFPRIGYQVRKRDA